MSEGVPPLHFVGCGCATLTRKESYSYFGNASFATDEIIPARRRILFLDLDIRLLESQKERVFAGLLLWEEGYTFMLDYIRYKSSRSVVLTRATAFEFLCLKASLWFGRRSQAHRLLIPIPARTLPRPGTSESRRSARESSWVALHGTALPLRDIRLRRGKGWIPIS